MIEKQLGKISRAEFGTVDDYPFLCGLQLNFMMGGSSGIGDGGSCCVNISPECRWATGKRAECLEAMVDKVAAILAAAKVDCVSKLVGIPVEITLDGNRFKDFRVLKEVL